MDRAFRASLLVAGVLAAVHVLATAASGLTLPDALRVLVGASPATTLTRPYAHFTAPFFHQGLPHLAYNLAILLATLPFALRAHGIARGVLAAYLASPAVGIAVNLLVILPLAGLGMPYAQDAVPVPLVGASVAIFAGAGMALAARPWSLGARAGVAAAFVAYEGSLALAGVTQPFVGVYHVGGFLLGMALSRLFRARAGSRRAGS